jgi:hypothetical protein
MSKRQAGILRYFPTNDSSDEDESVADDDSVTDPDFQVDVDLTDEQMYEAINLPSTSKASPSQRYRTRGKPCSDNKASQLLKKVQNLLKSNDPSIRILHIQGKGADGWKYGCEIMVKGNVLPYRFCRICLEAEVPILKQ